LLNIFFLSISFLSFKFFLLGECILLDRFLPFTLDSHTVKIATQITFTDTYTLYPDGQYKFFLLGPGYKEQILFLTFNWNHFSVHDRVFILVMFFYWLFTVFRCNSNNILIKWKNDIIKRWRMHHGKKSNKWKNSGKFKEKERKKIF
jgi:hypothetical protein